MRCPVCGEPLRPDYGEAVEPLTAGFAVYTVHSGHCVARLRAALVEVEQEVAR